MSPGSARYGAMGLKKRRRFRPVIIIIISVIPAVLLLTVLVLIQTPQAGRFMLKQADRYLRSGPRLTLKAGQLKVDLLARSVELEDVTVRATAASDLPPLFQAERIFVRPGIANIIRGMVDLQELRIDAPRIHYFAGADGRTNLPEGSQSSRQRPKILIAYADLKDGAFRFEDRRSATDLNFPRWHLLVHGDPRSLNHRTDFITEDPSSAAFGSRTVPLDSARFAGTLLNDGLRIEAFEARSGRSTLTASGAVNDLSDPTLDLVFGPGLDLAGVGRVLGRGIAGNLSGTVRVKGKSEDLQLEVQLRGTGVTAGPYRDARFSVKTQARWKPGHLRVGALQLDSPEGSLNGTADLYPGSGRGSNALDFTLRGFDLHPVWKLIKPPFDIAGRSTGNVSLRWRGPLKASSLKGRARLTLTAGRTAPDKHLLPLSGIIDARIEPNVLSGTLESFDVLGTVLNGRFSLLSLETLEAEIAGSTEHTDRMMAQIAQFAGEDDPTIIGLKLEGPAQFKAEAAGSLSAPRIEVSAEAPDLRAGILRGLSLKTNATVTIENSEVAFKSAVGLPQNSSALAAGTVEFGSGKTNLTIDAQADSVPASAVLATLGISVPAEGSISTTLHVDGPAANLRGAIAVSGKGLSVYREPVGDFEANVRISDGALVTDPFRIARDPQNPDANYVEARFSYLGSDQFEFLAEGKELALPFPNVLAGTADISASGSGTFQAPSIAFTLHSEDARLKQSPIGPISIVAELKDERAVIASSAPRFNASSTLNIAVHEPYPFDWKANIRTSDLSRLELKAPNEQPLAGTLAGSIEGSGDLRALREARFSAEIETLNLQAGDLAVQTAGPVRAEYLNHSVDLVTPATIVSRNSKLELAGSVPLPGSESKGLLTLKGEVDLAQAAGFVATPEGFGVEGTAKIDLILAGTPQRLSTRGTIALDGGLLRLPRIQTPLSDLMLRASVGDGSLVVEKADAAWGDGRVSLTGELPFGLLAKNIPVQFPRKEGPAAFALDLSGVRPELTGLLPKGISGLVSVRADGKATNLRDLNARIAFRELGFKANEIALGQNGTSMILVESGVASIERLALEGTQTSIQAAGTAGLSPDGLMQLQLLGNFDAGLLTFMNRDLKTAGRVQIQVAVEGTRRSPSFSGTAEMRNGRVSLREPRVVADSLTVKLDLAPDRITVREFNGTLNGGSLALTGTVGYQSRTLNDFDLKASIQDVFLEFPEGLKSASNGDLTITSSDDSIVIGGTVRVMDSSYRQSFEVSGQLMNYLRARRDFIGNTEPDPLLNRIRLDIALRLVTPVLVQNNMARLEATGSLRAVGSFYEPSLVGRITLNQGGEINLNQRTYYIERGTVTFSDQTQIKPEVDIQAQTRVDAYEITMRLTGPPERLLTTLTSEPSLPEPDIMSLLLTGKVSAKSTQQVAQSQALALIAGQAGEEVTREARQALHLSTLRIDPGGLIASESDVGARITIGEDITRNFSLAYSMNLVDGGEQIWAAQYAVTQALTTQATKQEDNSYRFEFRHDLRLGGRERSARRARRAVTKFTIGSIRLDGNLLAPEKRMLEEFGAKPGDRYEFPKIQKGLDNLSNHYVKQNRLEADIRLRRETKETTVDLALSVDPGPVVEFVYEGAELTPETKNKVAQAWKDGVFEIERLEDATAVIRRTLIEQGFLEPSITPTVETGDGRKTVLFTIQPGPRYSGIPILFPGASKSSVARLNDLMDQGDLRLMVYDNPAKVVDYLERHFRERGHLDARVELPQRQLNPQTGTGEISIPIHEGPLFLIGDLEFSGNSAFDYDRLWMVIPTSSGSIYSQASLRDSVRALENLYQSKGYNEAAVSYRIVQDSKAGLAHVTFQIAERRQSIIRDIVIEGTQDTKPQFVRRQLAFDIGDPLSYDRISETRRRLYASGVYTSVDLQSEEIEAAARDAATKDVRVRVRLREIRPYRLQYGFFYDTERGPGGLLEAQDLNLLGRATVLGMRLRYDSDLQEARLYFNQPFVKNNFLKLDATAFAQRETRTAFSANRIGFSVFRQKELQRKYVLDYGYRYDHVRWNGLPPDPTIFQASVPVARIVTTLTRDTRDSILDATKGEFTSHSLEFGPRIFGSEVGFTRYFGQYFRYVPLEKYLGKAAGRKEEGNPSSLVYAGALRLGLTGAFGGGSVVSPERFFAGGGTTMRGFKQDLLGPTETIADDIVRPVGGEAMFLFNNEIRFPIVSILQGVGFLDIGNVYPRISDFDFTLRKSAGIGLRLKIKFVPLRFDYGFKLDRKADESRGEFFFSIGQAF